MVDDSEKINKGRSGKLPEEFVPVWIRANASFYKKLKAISEEIGMSDLEVLKRGMRLALVEYRSANALSTKSEAARKLVAKRWAGSTAEERSEAARIMSRKRWSKRNAG